MAFIVSEDGGIDRIPHLKPRVSRAELDEAIANVKSAVESGHASRHAFQCIEWLEKHRFYLLESDCVQLNSLVPRVEELWQASAESEIRIVRAKFTADPAFDPAFYYSDNECVESKQLDTL